MYIVLGVLYESYIHPVTILSTLPSAGVGALLALLIAGSDLGIDRDHRHHPADRHREEERDHDDRLRARRRAQGRARRPREAIFQACLLRFRPILMTTMAALLGALPLMLGSGVGSELRHPLGITMVGGLIVSQVLTLFTTPVIYLAFDRLAKRAARRRAGRRAGGGAADESRGAVHRAPGRDDAARRRPRARRRGGLPLLPVSPLPQVDFPTISVTANLPGASPETMAATVATPLERALGRIAGVTEMTSSSLARLDARHAAVRPQPRHRRRGARRAGGDQRRAQPAADRAAEQSDLPQGQPGRRADHDPRAHLGHDDAGADVRRRVDDPRAEARRRWTASGR